VAQLATGSTAPAPNGAGGGEGEAVAEPCRHSDDTLASNLPSREIPVWWRRAVLPSLLWGVQIFVLSLFYTGESHE